MVLFIKLQHSFCMLMPFVYYNIGSISYHSYIQKRLARFQNAAAFHTRNKSVLYRHRQHASLRASHCELCALRSSQMNRKFYIKISTLYKTFKHQASHCWVIHLSGEQSSRSSYSRSFREQENGQCRPSYHRENVKTPATISFLPPSRDSSHIKKRKDLNWLLRNANNESVRLGYFIYQRTCISLYV